MKSDLRKRKAQVVEELEVMRQKVSELEAYKTSYLESEKELRESEGKLRLMFESVTDGITVTDLDGIITDVNRAILKLGGFNSESDIVGKSAFESIVLRDRERALADMMELLKRGTVGSGQYYLLRADGSEYPAEVNAGLLKDADGNPAGFISVIRDITERKQADELFQAISLRSPVGKYVIQDGKFVFANQQLLSDLGISEKKLLSIKPLSRVRSGDREIVRQNAVEMLKGKRTTPYEYAVINKRGETKWFIETVVPIQYRGRRAVLGNLLDITERKQAEEIFQTISMNSPASIYIDQDGNLIFANPRLLNRIGYTEEEMSSIEPSRDITHPDDREMVRQCRIDMLKGKRTTPYEYRAFSKTGEMFWVAETVASIQYRGRRAVLGIILDITERKQAEERLWQTRRRFRDLVNLLPLGVFEMDDQYNVTFANQQAVIMLGYEKADVNDISLYTLDACVPEDRERMEKNIERIMNGEELGGNEYTLRQVNGTTFPAVVHSRPIIRDDKAVGLRGVIIDTTESKLAEETLRESQRRFRDLVNLLPQGIYEMDAEYNITFANQWAIEASGYTEEEVNAVPLNALDTVIPEDRERMKKNIERIMNGEKVGGVEYTQISKDGRTLPIVTYSAPIRQDGRVVGLRGVTIDISERKQVEEIFQTISMSSPASIYIVQDGKFVFANHRFLDRVGLTEDELFNTGQYDLIHPEDREMVKRSAIEMLKGIRTTPYEYRAFNKSGEMMWVAETVASIQYQGRRAVLGSALNTTERKQAENLLRDILKNSPTSVYIFDGNKLQLVNPAFCQNTGYTEDELLAMNPSELIHPDDREIVEKTMIEMLERRSPEPFEFRGINKDGSVQSVIMSVAPIQYQGKPALLATPLNITERKQAEEALRESEEKYRILVENSQDSIIIVDFEGAIQLANQASERLSGYSLDEGIGMNIMEILTPAYWEEALKKLQQAKNGEPVPYFEAAIKRKDGTIVTIEACGQAVYKDGEAVGAQVITRDITERKRVEEERQRIERLESLGTLAGGIAHDFNNILTGIMGNIGLALRHMEPEGRATERLLEAEKASLRARNLTQQLLTFSKGSPPVKKNVVIGQLIEEAASFALRGSNVRFELTLSDDIWSVYVDEGQISGVISNLVINADEAMPEGGTIKIGARNRTIGLLKFLPLPRGNYVEVTIEDHGVGIPKEYLGRIFEPYFTTKQKGSGLGLATAYSIVKNHDGHISVESKLGVGSTFHVFLPASRETAPVAKATDGELSTPASGRILVMDDEEPIQQLLYRALTDVGYDVLLTGDGEEAVEQYTRAREAGAPFDAVILDLTVPGKMGGREAIGKLIEIDPDVRAIASSGYSTDPVISDFRNHGFRGVVAKPYRISELREALREVVDGEKGV
jgi:PAS domain S-box-containing protein